MRSSRGDSPIFYSMIASLGIDRDAAEARASDLAAVLADIEALHEPGASGECPTCGSDAPCLTLLLLRGDITLEQAFAAVREDQPIDLVAAERPDGPAVPSLKELLAAPTAGIDKFFEALLGGGAPGDRRSA